MDKHTLLIVIGMLGSSVIGIFIQAFFNLKKNGAETQNLTITGEISIGTAWQQYAKQQEEDTKKLRADFKELQANFLKLGSDFETMKKEKDAEIHAKDKKIKELSDRIDILESEVEMHRNIKK